jgi:tetratricopeptide (TPR) repeat protein
MAVKYRLVSQAEFRKNSRQNVRNVVKFEKIHRRLNRQNTSAMRRKIYGLGVLVVLLVGVYASLDRYAVSRQVATLERARTLIELDQIDAAGKELHWLLWFRPDHSEAMFLLGLGQLHDEKFSDAIVSLKVAHSNLDRVDNRPELREEIETALGTSLLLDGQLDDAEKYFRSVLARNPKADRVRSNLHEMYRRQRRMPEAMGLLEDRRKVFPADLSVLPRMLTLLNLPSPQETLTYFNQIEEKRPAQSSVQVALGLAHQELGQVEKAERFLRAAVSSDLCNRLAQVSLARSLHRQWPHLESDRKGRRASIQDAASPVSKQNRDPVRRHNW